MSKQGTSRKPLVIGIIAAVAVLAVLLVVLLTQCTGAPDTSSATTAQATEPTYSMEEVDLYWNVDRALYDGKSEAGMSSRTIGSDGYYHVRFFKDGKMEELLVANKAVVNNIEVRDLMGLVFDEDGIIVDVIPVEDLPVEKVAWKFYVQSVGTNIIKANSSNKFNGLEVLLDLKNGVKVYDMTGTTGEIGCETTAGVNDRVMAVADYDGNLLGVYIYDRTMMEQKFQAYCEHCDAEVTWTEWKSNNTLPKNLGHFQLQHDIQLKSQQSTVADAKICLDLNGHTVKGAEGVRIYSVHNLNGELAIMDTSEEKTGKFVAHGQFKDQGAIILVRYGAVYLYDGILDASKVVMTHASGGSAVYVAAQRYFFMNGGELIGGTTKPVIDEKTGKYNGSVGATVTNKGKFVLNEGIIRGGTAKSVYAWSNGKASYQRGLGGNIFCSSGSVFEMNGGEIKGGKAGVGGNIFLDGTAEFTITGGIISGGRTTDKGRNGGNIYVNTKATLTINGGTITGGRTYNLGANVYSVGTVTMGGGLMTGGKCLSVDTGKENTAMSSFNMYIANGSRFSMYGGKITGGVAVVDSSTTDGKHTRVLLSGLATIADAPAGRSNLNLLPGSEKVQVTVGNLYDRAKIYVTTSGVFSLKTKAENQDNFYSDIDGAEVLYVDECLALGRLACLCGSTTEEHIGECEGELLVWGPWTSDNSLPTAEGNYYLLKNVTKTGGFSIGKSDMTNEDKITVNYDLNGKTVSISKGRAFLTYGDMNIVDTVCGGKLVATGPSNGTDHSGVILMGGYAKVGLYSGTVALAADHFNLTHGGVFGVASNAVLNVYGGVIDGSAATGSRTETIVHEPAEGEEEGTTETVTTTTTVGKGGAIRVTGTLNLYNGTIIGGTTTTNSGAIFAEKSPATINIYGGTVKNGASVQGGNIYLSGGTTLNLAGGTITGGKTVLNSKGTNADCNGGNVYGGKNSTVNISSGLLENGYSVNGGGNMYAQSNVTISGGKITGGYCENSVQRYSLNLMLVNAKTHVSGGVIDGYMAVANTVENGSTLKLSGKPVIAGGETNLRFSSYPETVNLPVVTVEGVLDEGASIGVLNTGVVSDVTVAENVKAFHPDDSFYDAILNEEGKIAIGYVHCLCSQETHEAWCDGKDLLWQPWDGSNGIFKAGNYYLTKTTSGGQRSIGESGKDMNINIDLFGNTYTGNARAMLVHADVNIVDSVGGGKITAHGAEKDHSATILMAATATINLYQGTLTVEADHNTINHGGIIGVAGGAVLSVYPDGVLDASNVTVGEWGGAARVSGTMNIFGGTVIGGNASKIGGSIVVLDGGHLNMTSGTVENGKASSGGNIAVFEGSTASITGGVVKNGEAVNVGGNIYLVKVNSESTAEAGKMTIGGTAKVEGGHNTTANKHGGSIHIATGASLTLEGEAKISGGSATGGGGNIYMNGTLTIREKATITGGSTNGANMHYGANIYQSNGTLNLEGGIVEGYISSVNQGSAVVNISGNPEVNKGTTNLRLTYTGTGITTFPQINIVGELTGEGMIGIRMEDKADHRIDGAANTGLFISNENGAKAEYEKFFYADAPSGGEVIFMEDGLNVHGEGYRVACACGGRLEGSAYHTCEQKTWKPWKTASNLPDEGYYYLSTDVTGAYVNINGLKTDRELGIDLNGHTVTGRGAYRIFRLMDGNATDNTYKYTLTVTDNGNGEGKLIPVDNIADQGSVIWITEKNQTVNLFGGIIDGTGKTTTTKSGGMLVSVSRGVLNIYDGTFIGGTTPGNGAAIGVQYNDGGGTVNMYGGTIVGGNANNGRAIYVAYDSDANQGTFNMYGGSVVDGENTTGTNLFTMVGRMTLGGDAVIEELYLAKDKVITIHSSLDASKASVGLKMNTPGVFASNVETDISDMFTCLNKGCAIRYNADKTLEMFTQHTHCFCYGAEVLPEGHVCNKDQIWQPVERTPGVPQTLADGGYYYLNWTGESAQPLVIPSEATVYLCLNGASIRANETIQLGTKSKIVICDCSEHMTGEVTTAGKTPLLVDGNATAILMSGNINGTYGTAASVITVKTTNGATFEMYGGKLLNGCATPSATKFETESRGGNLTVDGTVKLMGGTIEGGKYGNNNRDVTVFANAGSHCTVGGKIKIGYTMVANNGILHVIEKDFDGDIGVTMATTSKPIATVSTDVSGCFHSVHATLKAIGWRNGSLYLGELADHQHCICEGAEALPAGHSCDTFTAWTPIEKGTGVNTTLEDGGHYYLNWTGYSAQSLTVADNATVSLCLNGATIYATNVLTIGTGATLNICDCSEGMTGRLGASGATTDAIILLNSGTKTVNLYGGTITGSHANEGTKKVPTVYLSGGTGTFNMYGGVIADGYNGSGHGGNVSLTGVNCAFNMFGGTITGGSVASGKHGGNIYISKATFTMNGGTITGGFGATKGGNVMVLPNGTTATFIMNGGTITNGSAVNGGNVCVNAISTGGSAVFTMTGGTIKNGTASENGGNMFINSDKDTVTINAGSIIGGAAANGACIYNNGTDKLTIGEGATVDSVTNK